MEIKNENKFNSHPFFFLISGVIVVAFSILVYLLILKSFYGRYSVADVTPSFTIVEDLIFGGNPEIAILYSNYSRNMLPANNNYIKENISTWERFLENQDYKFLEINDLQIENGDHFKHNLLILPGTLSLSDREIINIKKYVANGGSIFATSGTATHSDDGKWRGWDFFSEVFGVKFSREISTDEGTKIHTLRGGLPLTVNIPTGFPLQVATWDKPMAVEVLDPRTKQLSFWYNYRLEEGLVREEIKNSAGIVYGTYGKGRFIWMGFEINSILGVHDDYIFFERFFNNSLNWLTEGPIAQIKDWPEGFEAAAVITPCLTSTPENIKNLLPILQKDTVTATFFLEPFIAVQNKFLIKEISNYGEIAALIDIGYLSSKEDRTNTLDDFENQLLNLNNGKNKLEQILGKKISGFMPYYGLFDENTIKAIMQTDFKYMISDSLADRSVPKSIIRGKDRFIAITKTARDDYEIIRDNNLLLPEFQFYSYQEDLDRVLFEGGLYVYKFHTEFQCKPENINVARAIIKDLKRKKFWITTISEIQQWYKTKENIEIRSQKRGNRRVVITISNPGEELIKNLVVDVDLNVKAYRIGIQTEIIGTKIAEYNHKDGTRFVVLNIDELQPGESRTYYIDFDLEPDKLLM